MNKLCLLVVVLALGWLGQAPAAATEVDPLEVLHKWDQERQDAYVAADASKLTDLYADGSSAAKADVAVLEAYRERGLRVRQIQQQFFSAKVLGADPTHIRIRTVERFAGGLAMGEGRCQRIRPTFPQVRVISMVHDGTRWRVESVNR